MTYYAIRNINFIIYLHVVTPIQINIHLTIKKSNAYQNISYHLKSTILQSKSSLTQCPFSRLKITRISGLAALYTRFY